MIKKLIILVFLLLLVAGCSDIPDKIEDPVISPESGVYSGSVEVSIVSPSNGEIYYTTNGANPAGDNSIRYSEPFEITQSSVVKAVVLSEGLILPSNVVQEVYTIN